MVRLFSGVLSASLVFLALTSAVPASQDASLDPNTGQNSEALEMIAERMRSLTKSLEGLPEPPAFKQRIQLPDELLVRQNDLTKENKDE